MHKDFENKEWIRNYFRRLGMEVDINDAATIHTYDFLKELQYRHVTTIPYENLDLVSGVPISLDIQDMYEKFIQNKRGGYCFEVNGLLSALLKELGFPVRNCLGRYLRGATELPVRHHRVLEVTCGEEVYLCDVGIGQPAPRHPLKLQVGLIQSQFGEQYKFEKEEDLGWVLYDLHHGAWRPFYSFTEELQTDKDFILPSFYCEKHPDSKFNKTYIVALKTAKGRKTINDREFKEFADGEVLRLEENLDDTRLLEVLKSEFDIEWKGTGTL